MKSTRKAPPPKAEKVYCEVCERWIKKAGMDDHIKAVHEGGNNEKKV